MKHSRRNYDKRKVVRKLIPLFLAVIVVAATAGIISQTADRKKMDHATQEAANDQTEDIVEINGVKCVPKRNIKTYLFMGLDSQGEAKAAEEYDGTGLILSRLVDTFSSRILYPMLPLSVNHSIAVV